MNTDCLLALVFKFNNAFFFNKFKIGNKYCLVPNEVAHDKKNCFRSCNFCSKGEYLAQSKSKSKV